MSTHTDGMTVQKALRVIEEVANLSTERSRHLDRIAAVSYNGGRGTKRIAYVGDYCSYYHSWVARDMTFEQYEAAGQLLASYKAALVHLESLVEWEEIDRIHWADNSVEVVERATDGAERRRQLVAPHGDVCF